MLIYSHVGSLAKLRKRQTFSIEPFSSKSCLKNLAVSMLTWRRWHSSENGEEGREREEGGREREGGE